MTHEGKRLIELLDDRAESAEKMAAERRDSKNWNGQQYFFGRADGLTTATSYIRDFLPLIEAEVRQSILEEIGVAA